MESSKEKGKEYPSSPSLPASPIPSLLFPSPQRRVRQGPLQGHLFRARILFFLQTLVFLCMQSRNLDRTDFCCLKLSSLWQEAMGNMIGVFIGCLISDVLASRAVRGIKYTQGKCFIFRNQTNEILLVKTFKHRWDAHSGEKVERIYVFYMKRWTLETP